MANDKFGPHDLTVRNSLYLGVPSKKFRVIVPAVSAWGLATLALGVIVRKPLTVSPGRREST